MIEGLLIGAAVYAAGLFTSRFLPARKRGPKPVEPVCGCGHHHGFHDPQTGECHGKMLIPGYGHNHPCTCRQYSGPVPLPEYIAPEIQS